SCGKSLERECAIVTVAFSLSSNCTSGRPTRLERPITIAFMPSSEACTLLVRMMQPSGVQGDSAAKPPASRPALFGCRPSTSLAGSIALMTVSVWIDFGRSEEHTSELQSPDHLVCRLLLE